MNILWAGLLDPAHSYLFDHWVKFFAFLVLLVFVLLVFALFLILLLILLGVVRGILK